MFCLGCGVQPVRTIKTVARQTGLSVHTIRAWEKRYGLVEPTRADNNRRLYTERDIERLRLLRFATEAGHAIGQIAQLSTPELRRLLEADAGTPSPSRRATAPSRTSVLDNLFASAMRAVRRLDAPGLRDLLDHAAVELGSPTIFQKFIGPLAQQIGEDWKAGELNIAHERFATTTISAFLANFARPYGGLGSGPHIVFATPAGQLHELGALTAAAAARAYGWRSTYLGGSLPIEEVIRAALALAPRAIGLSIVFPPEDSALKADLLKLPKLLPKSCAVLIGGHSAAGYSAEIRKIRAIRIESLADFFPVLDQLAR